MFIPVKESDPLDDSLEVLEDQLLLDPVTGNPEPKVNKRKKKDADWCESEDEYTGGLSTKKKRKTSRLKDPKLHLTMRERCEVKKLSYVFKK